LIKNILRRIRGALGNALVWAGTWFVAAFSLTAVFWVGTFGSFPFWPSALGLVQTLLGLGLLAGFGFSLYLGIAGRNRSLKELRSGWVALGTGLTVGFLVPVFGVYFGDAPLARAIEIASYTGVLSGFTALAQIKIAQKALTRGEAGPDELESGQEQLLPDPEVEAV
jgi:hypothetical protein